MSSRAILRDDGGRLKAVVGVVSDAVPLDLTVGRADEIVHDTAVRKEVQSAIAAALHGAGLLVNPYADLIFAPTRGYPPEFRLTGWEEQAKILDRIFPELTLDMDELREMAGRWPEEFFRQTAVHEKGPDEGFPLWDGLGVFALPGPAAEKCGLGRLWEDVAKGRDGDGLWGRLHEEILFPRLKKLDSFRDFQNLRTDQMGADRFLPTEDKVEWFKALGQIVSGDFALQPLSFGQRLAGHPMISSRWMCEANGWVGCPTWLNGNFLTTSPGRLQLQRGFLGLDCDDQYRFGDAREFLHAPFFSRVGASSYFYTAHVRDARSRFGLSFVLR